MILIAPNSLVRQKDKRVRRRRVRELGGGGGERGRKRGRRRKRREEEEEEGGGRRGGRSKKGRSNRSSDTMRGLSHRSNSVRSVECEGQEKTWMVVWSSTPQEG